MTDIDLLRGYTSQAKVEFFEALVEKYSGMVYAVCMRILRNAHDAQDTVQETFLALAGNAHRIRANVASWLHGTARNLALKHIRKTSSRRRVEEDYGQNVAVVSGVPTADLQELAHQLDTTLNELAPWQQDLLLRRFFAGANRTGERCRVAEPASRSCTTRRRPTAAGENRGSAQQRATGLQPDAAQEHAAATKPQRTGRCGRPGRERRNPAKTSSTNPCRAGRPAPRTRGGAGRDARAAGARPAGSRPQRAGPATPPNHGTARPCHTTPRRRNRTARSTPATTIPGALPARVPATDP